jgi:hypothetical protein
MFGLQPELASNPVSIHSGGVEVPRFAATVDGVNELGISACSSQDYVFYGVGNTDHRPDPWVMELPLVEMVELKCDATIDHYTRVESHPGGGQQTGRVSPSLVGVEDCDPAVVEVVSEFPGGANIQRTPKAKTEKGKTSVTAGGYELATRSAPDLDMVAALGQTPCRRQHLHHRAGRQTVLIDQVEDAEWPGHGESIRRVAPKAILTQPSKRLIARTLGRVSRASSSACEKSLKMC